MLIGSSLHNYAQHERRRVLTELQGCVLKQVTKEATMSDEANAIENKQQKHPKLHFQRYLFNSGEPRWNESSFLPPELEAELLENSYDMRRNFRHIAKNLRNRYL